MKAKRESRGLSVLWVAYANHNTIKPLLSLFAFMACYRATFTLTFTKDTGVIY